MSRNLWMSPYLSEAAQVNSANFLDHFNFCDFIVKESYHKTIIRADDQALCKNKRGIDIEIVWISKYDTTTTVHYCIAIRISKYPICISNG